jgi:hypothetical protein
VPLCCATAGPNLATVTVPWAREEPHPEEVISKDEPKPQEPATVVADLA